jgi:hypothetical protein
MPVQRRKPWGKPSIRPLSKQEIDRRMADLVSELLTPGGGQARDPAPTPRLISPAELVRRMSRFLVYN